MSLPFRPELGPGRSIRYGRGPELDHIVGSRRGQGFSIRAESNAPDGIGVRVELRFLSARAHVPEPDGLVEGAGGQPLSIRAEGDRANSARVPGEVANVLCGRGLPDLDGGVFACGSQELSIRREGDSRDPVLMTFHRARELHPASKPGPPELDELVGAGCCQGLSVGGDCHTPDGALMRFKSTEALPGGCVEEVCLAGPDGERLSASGRQYFAIAGEGDGCHPAGMAREGFRGGYFRSLLRGKPGWKNKGGCPQAGCQYGSFTKPQHGLSVSLFAERPQGRRPEILLADKPGLWGCRHWISLPGKI